VTRDLACEDADGGVSALEEVLERLLYGDISRLRGGGGGV
jgi:hypothetical protein